MVGKPENVLMFFVSTHPGFCQISSMTYTMNHSTDMNHRWGNWNGWRFNCLGLVGEPKNHLLPWCRWINGNQEAMKDSARYPIWFGRAWVFVHEHMKKNPRKEMSHAVLNVFTAKMVQRMFIDEDMVFQLIVISLGAQFIICVFFSTWS